jgi:hypothetical protein
MLPMPATSLRVIAVIGAHPIARLAVTTTVASVASSIAFRASSPMRPETEAAQRLDRAGLRFVLRAVLDGLLLAMSLLVASQDV